MSPEASSEGNGLVAMNTTIQKHKQYLLNGVSFAIPFIASGGILIALAIGLAPMGEKGPDFSNSPTLKLIYDIGQTSFRLLYPVLAGYISHAIVGKPGLVPGFVGGYICGEIDAGFLGALVAGLLAGHCVNLIKKIKIPKVIRPVVPIIIIPVSSSLIVGFIMLKVIGIPIANMMLYMGNWLGTMGQGSAVLLAMILGAMIAFDMGGPVNKTAFFFAASMIEQSNYTVMGCVAVAICTPPLGMGLATLIGGRRWNEEEREAGIASLGMGVVGITEGAIPFAVVDPFRVIPCIMVGSMVGAVIAMVGKAGDHAPHGGPIVLPVVDNRAIFLIAIAAGTVLTALLINCLKKIPKKKEV
jgi:fructose-specific phosphotransferase system IIC component